MKKHTFRILMAEDDPAICLIVPMILHRLGHEVDVVRDGREAIIEYAGRPGQYDILLTDHEMPEVSGLELIGQLRRNGFAGKIIVMSGALSDELMHAYLSKRVDRILQKPFTVEMLSVTLGELLQQWREEDGG